jgi:hypothetical protein
MSHWKRRHSLALLLILLLLTGLASSSLLLDRTNQRSLLWCWGVLASLLTILVFILGHGVVDRGLGALIDERNRMSLSRLQLLLWVLLVLSGFSTAALWNLVVGHPDPLQIALPSQLWSLLGISTASLVGSPLILSTKRDRAPQQQEMDRTKQALAGQKTVVFEADDKLLNVTFQPNQGLIEKINAKGQLLTFAAPILASPADLFKGDETGNGAHLDLGKVQMFFFTIILVMTYGVSLGTLFTSLKAGAAISSFPSLDQGMVTLLGISHAGYLANKAVPHSASPQTPIS